MNKHLIHKKPNNCNTQLCTAMVRFFMNQTLGEKTEKLKKLIKVKMKRTKERFRLPFDLCVMNMLRKRAKNDFGFRGRKSYISSNRNTWLMIWHTKWGLMCNKRIKGGQSFWEQNA